MTTTTTVTSVAADKEAKITLESNAWIIMVSHLADAKHFSLITDYERKIDLPNDHWTEILVIMIDADMHTQFRNDCYGPIARTASLQFLKAIWNAEVYIINPELYSMADVPFYMGNNIPFHIPFTLLLSNIVLRDDEKEAEKIMGLLLDSQWETISEEIQESVVFETLSILADEKQVTTNLKGRCHLIKPLLARWRGKIAIPYIRASGNRYLLEEVVRFFRHPYYVIYTQSDRTFRGALQKHLVAEKMADIRW